ncbi:Structural maintenance of chromosomes protein 6 [Conglomerata obtusa]
MTITFKSLELINFMCHSHLKINFNKRVTFIGGLNGSGKSAIMIAIGLILGERVKNLERGNSCKDLIKTNSTFCIIRLTMHNTISFHTDFFQDEIILERKITDRSSLFCIRNSDNKIWKRTREDLDVLLESFSITFSNPLNFLTQEHAKKFLNISKPRVLYEFFMKGTELEDNKALHREAAEEVSCMESKMVDIQRRTEIIDKELRKRRDKIEAIENTKQWITRLKELEAEREWSGFDFSLEKKLELELCDLNSKLMQDQDQEIVLVNKIQQMKQNHLKEIEEMRNKRNEIQAIEREKQMLINEFEMNKREIENDLKEIEESIKTQKHELKEHQMSSNEDKINSLNESIIENKEKCKEYIAEKDKCYIKKNEIDLSNEKEEERISKITIQKNQIKRMIEDNKRIKNNNLAFFGEKMPDLVNAIKTIKFKGEIIGPLSNEITLTEKKWFKPVSLILNNFLNSFIVFKKEDKEKLFYLFQRFNLKNVSVFVPSSRNNTLIKYRKNKNFKTVLDVISCTNNVVINQLIILAQIESIILIEERSVAHRIIKTKPIDVDCAFTLNGDQIKMYGSNLTDFGLSNNERYFFQNSIEKLVDLESKLKEIMEKDVTNNYKNESYSIKRRINELETYIDRLENSIRSNEIELKTLASIKTKIHEKDIDRITEELDINSRQSEDLQAAIRDLDNKINKCKNEIKLLNNSNFYDEDSFYKNKRELDEQLFLLKYKTNSLRENINKKINELNNFIEKANNKKEILFKLGYKFDKVRNTDIIEEEIYELQSKINLNNEKINERDVKSAIEDFLKEKNNNEELYNEYKTKIENINYNIKLRIERREAIKTKESIRASNEFKDYMSLRDYEGKLIFNHEEELLEIKVRLKNNKVSGDKNTLSGGEKSYAGVCLLLSLWPSVCCPVKILDEFDVYMDNLNRKSAIDSIINYFKDDNSQLILITPLDTQDLNSETCNVIVLQPPKK